MCVCVCVGGGGVENEMHTNVYRIVLNKLPSLDLSDNAHPSFEEWAPKAGEMGEKLANKISGKKSRLFLHAPCPHQGVSVQGTFIQHSAVFDV